MVTCGHVQSNENQNAPMCPFSAKVKIDSAHLFQHSHSKQMSFSPSTQLIVCFYFIFSLLCLFLIIFLFKMIPEYSADMVSSVHKYKKAAVCLTFKIYVREKLHPGMNFRTVGCKFYVNEPTSLAFTMIQQMLAI